ncbi:MAG: hypothetical protein HFH48_01315 [Lachnospiraceae bacterium]|nr:hypothetical protein [Lachnospiraceae bacterium]
MEELFVFALLLCEGMVTREEYGEKLDELFLNDPENDDLLYLEWETDIKKSIAYIRAHVDYNVLDCESFGRIFMGRLKENYENCPDIGDFAKQAYHLWKSLPGNIQNKEPFFALCYGDDPLSWGDEEQTRSIYEYMMNYYDK